MQEENTALRHKIEDLSAKLRRTEVLLARVTDELAKYRTAKGKTPLLNIDEEQCLRIKLQVILRVDDLRMVYIASLELVKFLI